MEVGFALDDIVGDLADGLLFRFVADLGAAEDDCDIGPELFEEADDLETFPYVPDIDAESDNFRGLLEDGFDRFEGALLEVEFEDGCPGLEVAEVGEEVSQAERGVDVFCVQGCEDNIRHAGGEVSGEDSGAQPASDFGFGAIKEGGISADNRVRLDAGGSWQDGGFEKRNLGVTVGQLVSEGGC